MKPQPEEGKASVTFDDWLKELIKVTAEKVGDVGDVIKINTDAAKEFYDSGFTPEQCFRESWGCDND